MFEIYFWSTLPWCTFPAAAQTGSFTPVSTLTFKLIGASGSQWKNQKSESARAFRCGEADGWVGRACSYKSQTESSFTSLPGFVRESKILQNHQLFLSHARASTSAHAITLSLCVSLSFLVFLSFCLSVCLSVCLSMSLSLSETTHTCAHSHHSLSLSLSLSLFLSLSLSHTHTRTHTPTNKHTHTPPPPTPSSTAHSNTCLPGSRSTCDASRSTTS